MKKSFLTLVCLLAAATAIAQEKYFYFSLDFNKPLSNTDWIGDASASGFKAGYRGFFNRKFSAGLDLGSATFQQYNPTETHQNGNGAITTDFFKYIYSYSAVVSGQYHFQVGEGETIFPYVGFGAGANTNQYVIYYNIYQDSERGWGFLARPEAGILVKIGRRGSFGLMAAVHFDYSTNKSDNFGYDNFLTAGGQIGVILIDL